MPPVNTLQFPFLTRKMLAFETGRSISLLVSCQSTVASDLVIKGMTREGPFTLVHNTDGQSTQDVESFNLPDIPIWISMNDGSAAWEQGECYATAILRIDGMNTYTMASGYVSYNKSISWPQTTNIDPQINHGKVTSAAGTNPAAGAEISDTITTGQFWLLKSIRFSLVADATVSNRTVNLSISDGTNVLYQIPATAVQTASQTVVYNFGVALPFNNNSTALVQTAPIPDSLLLRQSYKIATVTTNLQAGDNYGAPRYFYENFFSNA